MNKLQMIILIFQFIMIWAPYGPYDLEKSSSVEQTRKVGPGDELVSEMVSLSYKETHNENVSHKSNYVSQMAFSPIFT